MESFIHRPVFRGAIFPHLERGAVVPHARVLFALPVVPDVFIQETGQSHAFVPMAVAIDGMVEIGGMLDVHLHPANDAPVLSASLQHGDAPFIGLYRCLRLLACHRRIDAQAICLVLESIAHNRPLAGYEDRWDEIRSSCPTIAELCHALDVALESGLSIFCALREIYHEIEAGRLAHDPALEEFGVMSPADLVTMEAHHRGLVLCLEGPFVQFLRVEQGRADGTRQARWMLALAVAFERMFRCQLVHALGLVLLLWKRIPAFRRSDPVDAAEGGLLMASLPFDAFDVIADALWADGQARAMIPPAQSEGTLPLPIAWHTFKKPFAGK